MRQAEPADLGSVLDVLGELVAFDTVPGASTVAMAEAVAERLDSAGLRVRLHREHALGAEKAALAAVVGPPESGGLVLTGHMDVVPHADQPGWTRPASRLTRDSTRAYGRGTADMKGFLAQCIALGPELAALDLRRPVVLLFTSDEEVGCQGAGRLLPHLGVILEGTPLPRQALIGEPTDFAVYRAHKGHVRVSVVLEGSGGHSSRPDLGVNAIAALEQALRATRELADEAARRSGPEASALFPEFPATAFNAGLVRGGTADNMIAERCELTLGFRPLPGENPEVLLLELEERIAAAVHRHHPGTTVRFEGVVITPPMRSPASGPLAESLARFTGDPGARGAPFATDGGQLARAGLDSWICGPGELSQAHQPDESIPLTNLERGLDLIRTVVRDLCL